MDNNGFDKCKFSQEIVQALEDLGFETLTEVQQQVIPLALADTDVIVRSQTGSGKTAAFAIPVCEKIEVEQRYPQALVLTPTRELAVQLKQDIANIGRFKKIRCVALFGRQPMEAQKRELKQRVHVIVGTPGRTFDHIVRKNVNLDELKYLIIDEADKMLDMGFIDQVEAIVKMLPINRVTMVFSATMPDKIQEICNQYLRNPVKIEVDSEIPPAELIQQACYEVQDSEKINLALKIIYTKRPDSCLVFCNTRERVEMLFDKMKKEGVHCGSLHGGMEQRERLQAMQSFKRGEFSLLIATDVAARGIHVDGIALVINYDIPVDNESYVHRIGRTGRAGKEGMAITFVTPDERSSLAEIEQYIDYQIPRQETPTVEAAESGKLIFDKNKAMPNYKSDKSDNLNKNITRIRINAGKKTKMRPGDILGAITNIAGVSAADTGIIDIQDTCSYVEILGGKGDLVMEALLHTKIKGKVHTIKKVNIFP
ncbi:ATP-dependent RNA helicase DbpA [Sporomusa silvacetica DSM 10669]|uniref:ATP-dependent RNA helicase DbpA n=1 Tax=Sporomusa silvacetica DSM 10669 TaxID=1123289 RepID=A0ABZ3ISN0_9FIRM|nr:DEAD/DEAH box helicase [Sporomusa silvacetica]OZC15428.1 ATP-dependent RNA helicase DbpA [Sporomusa silvacetica DSM 10669]